MLEIAPKIECGAISKNYGRFVIGPLASGFGITVGNALRRVLLSSLPGAAVTSIKINNVHHEFSPIPHAKEDTTRLILNVKQLRLRSHSPDSVRLLIRAKGEGVVTAGDIECPSSVEIINPELHLLTLDSEDADLEMEMVVQQGTGYSPAEERGKLPIGEIPVDAIFSPVRKVGFRVEKTRAGQATDLDNLIVEVWTDGTIQAREALSQAAQILVDHLLIVAGYGRLLPEGEVAAEEGIASVFYEMPIEDLPLSVRAYNCLKRAGISKVGQVLERLRRGDEEMLVIRNFGQKSLDELKDALRRKNIPMPWEQVETENEAEAEALPAQVDVEEGTLQ